MKQSLVYRKIECTPKLVKATWLQLNEAINKLLYSIKFCSFTAVVK